MLLLEAADLYFSSSVFESKFRQTLAFIPGVSNLHGLLRLVEAGFLALARFFVQRCAKEDNYESLMSTIGPLSCTLEGLISQVPVLGNWWVYLAVNRRHSQRPLVLDPKEKESEQEPHRSDRLQAVLALRQGTLRSGPRPFTKL